VSGLIAVPAYFRPGPGADDWARLVERSAALRFVVINVDSGPGDGPCAEFVPAVDALRTAGVPLVGYVDSGYGRRPEAELLRELDLYRNRYNVDGLFLDQVRADAGGATAAARLAAAVRAVGGGPVVFNHGTVPDPAYAALADVLITFEGPMTAYRTVRGQLRAPDLVGPSCCHLVYDVPGASLVEAVRIAEAAGAETLLITDGGGANPWNRLPTYFGDLIDLLTIPAAV
jgi:hypothetical protein